MSPTRLSCVIQDHRLEDGNNEDGGKGCGVIVLKHKK